MPNHEFPVGSRAEVHFHCVTARPHGLVVCLNPPFQLAPTAKPTGGRRSVRWHRITGRRSVSDEVTFMLCSGYLPEAPKIPSAASAVPEQTAGFSYRGVPR